MKPNQLPKVGASLIGWEYRSGLYIPIAADTSGNLQVGIPGSVSANVTTLTQKFPILETIQYPDQVIPAGGAYQFIADCQLGEDWVLYFVNIGANSTTNMRLQISPGDPTIYPRVQTYAAATAIASGAMQAVNTVIGTFLTSKTAWGIPWVRVEFSSTLGTTMRIYQVRRKSTNP